MNMMMMMKTLALMVLALLLLMPYCSLAEATESAAAVAAAVAGLSFSSPVLLDAPSSLRTLPFTGNDVSLLRLFLTLRGGGGAGIQYGRVSKDEFIFTPEQVEAFHRDGCVTIPDVLTEEEVQALEQVADRFFSGEIAVPGKDFCDISKPFGIPQEDWSLVNCMLPTKYYPLFRDNVFEKLTCSMSKQLFPYSNMVKDYDQFLNKRPGKTDAVFAWHQDMAYWPGAKALGGVDITDTCTFSLALDDSDPSNGCLRYVVGSGVSKTLLPHVPLCGNRDEGHAVTVQVDETVQEIRHAPAKRGSITIHDEYVVHGSSGNTCRDRQRRTYVIAHRAKEIVDAERKIGFTHSHNDEVNWDTFNDGESHRVKLLQQQQQEHDE